MEETREGIATTLRGLLARETGARGCTLVAIGLYRAQMAMGMEGETPGCPRCARDSFLQSLRELPSDMCPVCWTSSNLPDVQQTALDWPDVETTCLGRQAHWLPQGH